MSSLSPEIFDLLESQEIKVAEGIENLIKDNLASTREPWLVNSLVDYYYLTQSKSVVGILYKVGEPHEKFLLEKLHDGIKSQEHQLNALQLLLHIVCKQPFWVTKIVSMSVLKVVIKALKVEVSIPVLMTGVTIVTILLPSIPTMVGPYLPDIFEVFNRLASFTVKKPPGNTPDIFYLHLQISVYALFHRLYGMFPYNFLAYLRQYYAKKENLPVFEEVIKCMLERVRVHPLLITGNREQETSNQRWRSMEIHDIVVECNKMSLDPVEGTWEELHCPIIAGRYLTDRVTTSQDRQKTRHVVQPLTLPTVCSTMVADVSQSSQAPETFWSPSEVISLSTPPPTPVASSVEITFSNIPSVPHAAVSALTPMNTPVDTPPISEEHERTMSRINQGSANVKILDPKRLSSEFSSSQPVPMLTPLSHVPSVPPSPLKAEFTNTPPQGVKSLPVVIAARELQFDHDQSEDKMISHVTKISQSRTELSRQLMKTAAEFRHGQAHIASQSEFEGEGPNGSLGVSDQEVRTPSRTGSLHLFEDSLKESAPVSSYPETSHVDSVSIDTVSRMREDQGSNDEDSDDEVSELTSGSRSQYQMTSESVKKFMKSVNRIRFNSLTVAEQQEQKQTKFGCKRSRSCPQFPKLDLTIEENEGMSRSASASEHNMEETEVTFDTELSTTETPQQDEAFNIASTQTSDSLGDISVTSTNSTITISKKQESKVTFSLSSTSESVAKCPVYTTAEGSVDQATNELVQLLKHVLDVPTSSLCSKCQAVTTGEQATGTTKSFFSTFSPPELLDMHIKLGRDIYTKELSRLPMTSTQDVNWTHFGGVPPADEISIVRGQLMLLHNQLLYERHKRDQHAKRNRRLLRKITHTKSLEEQNVALVSQLQQNEVLIRDLQVSMKLLQEENLKLKKEKDLEISEKFVQLRCCLKENEDLKNAKKEFNMLLVRQREEQDQHKQRLMDTEFKLFHAEKELEKMRDEASANIKLKDQVLHLQKELLLMGELQQRCNDKILAHKMSRASRLESEHWKNTLSKELKVYKQQLLQMTVQLESCENQMLEQQEMIVAKEMSLTDLKSQYEKMKTCHNEEIKCIEDKYQAAVHVSQSLEAHVLQLYAELQEAKDKLNKERPRVREMPGYASQPGKACMDQQDLHPNPKRISRTVSLPVDSPSHIQTTQNSFSLGPLSFQGQTPESAGADNFTSQQTLSEDEYELIQSRDSGEDSYGRCTGSEATFGSSQETGTIHQKLLNTESEDSRSASVRSNTTGDSGLHYC